MTEHYCECCFAPTTPKTINTTHRCDPTIKARREKEREEAAKELEAMDYESGSHCGVGYEI